MRVVAWHYIDIRYLLRLRVVEAISFREVEDFGERLEDLKELSGLSGGDFAKRLSVTQRGLAKWRNGAPPSGAYFWAIIELARELPGGFELIFAGDAEVEDDGHVIPPLPENFRERLGQLEDMSGISLEDFARAFGLSENRVREWYGGGMPTTDEVWAMALWAGQIPGGSDVLLASGFPFPPATE